MWKQCSEKYEASTDGHIRNIKTKRVLREFIGKDGYLRTQFDGKSRLVAKRFEVAPQTICAVVSGQNWKE